MSCGLLNQVWKNSCNSPEYCNSNILSLPGVPVLIEMGQIQLRAHNG